MKNKGTKFDTGKLRWDLLPIEQIESVVKVITDGAKVYGDNNWKEVENAKERYFAALMRHIVKWRKGEILDKDTKSPHLAHALCNLIFLLEFEKEANERTL